MPIGPLVQAPVTGQATIPVDVLASLQEFRFGQPGIGFPVVQTSMTLRQDLTIHKFADRDGAHVEACGRHPIQITARIAFINGLVPGPQETWNPNNLFPGAWSQFLKLALNRSSQPLQHPELGKLTCKLDNFKTDFDGKVRGGVWVDATWIESDDTATELVNSIASQAPSSAAIEGATGLDKSLSELGHDFPGLAPLLKTLKPPESNDTVGTFQSLVNGALQNLTTATQYEWQVQGALNSAIYQATRVENAAMTVQTGGPGNPIPPNQVITVPQALLWPLFQSAEQLKDAAYTLQAQMLNRQPSILLYDALKDSTIAQVANILQADVADILQLNVGLSTLNYVPAGTQVRYYAQVN